MSRKTICLNPKLIISDHFDSTVREIDIAVEEVIQQYATSDNQVYANLNQVRDEMIAKVREVQKEAVELYETRLRDQLNNDETFKGLDLAEEKENYLHSKLFANKSIGFFRRSRIFSLIEFDFHVDKSLMKQLQ